MSKIKTRLLLISDTHTYSPFSAAATSSPPPRFRPPIPAADVCIHAGDLTMTGPLSEHRVTVEMLKQLPAPIKIVIPGNHDMTLDRQFAGSAKGAALLRERSGNRLWRSAVAGLLPGGGIASEWADRGGDGELDSAVCRALYTDEAAQRAGIVYVDEGVRDVRLPNGARLVVYGSGYSPEFFGWAFAYPRTRDRYNDSHRLSTATAAGQHDGSLECDATISDLDPTAAHIPEEGDGASEAPVPIPAAASVVVTHGPPRGFGDNVPGAGPVGCDHLLRAVAQARPLLHVFGHIHEGVGAERVWWEGEEGEEDARARTTERLDGRAHKKGESGIGADGAAYLDLTGLERGRETVFVNASIMTVRYQPTNPPWVVDLELPAA